MATIADSIGVNAFSDMGVGVSVKPEDVPQETDIIYASWAHGLNTGVSPENVQQDAVHIMTDFEVDPTDALIRAPGIVLDQNVSPRNTAFMFQQSTLNYSTELVIIDPPFVGHKSTGAFTFASLAISATTVHGWATTVYAGTLLFSDGNSKTYTRAAGANTVTDVSANVVAQCFGQAFGRVFAGGFVDPINGLMSQGVQWNAANASLTDWTSLGSGSELLIANEEKADRVVAIVPLGLQAIGILMRSSLWAGYETNISNRPADFQLRFIGLGCIARDTARATPYGIMYLSDEGICLYDLNTSQPVSKAVNSLIFPIDYTTLLQYTACYDDVFQRYILSTPRGIFVYEFPHEVAGTAFTTGVSPARWFFRSFIADCVVSFTVQSGGTFWNNVGGTWGQQTLEWVQMVVGGSDAPPAVYFGRAGNVGIENYGATTFMGTAMAPLWQSRESSKETTHNFETHWLEVDYRSPANATVNFMFTDTSGNFTNTLTKTLPNTAGARSRVLIGTQVLGRGTEMQVSIGATTLISLERIRRVVMDAGPSVVSAI